jgi:protoporphyrinogen oxidase
MKIAILGGGFAGLSAAFYLRKKGYTVTIFEREPVLGGLAVGFKQKNWDWPLERAYHHIFDTDNFIRDLAKDSGYTGIFFKNPVTASLYKVGDNYRTFPVDTPQEALKFPLLPLIDKLRVGVVAMFLKFSPPLPIYESSTSEKLFSKLMGKRAWETIFGELMRKKFGKYAGNILASFIWARIKVRGKSLGYMEGGFQSFVEYLEKTLKKMSVAVNKGHEVNGIEKREEEYKISYKDEKGNEKQEVFDVVISTLPTPIVARLTGTLFPANYFEKFKKLHHLNAVVLILESKEPLLNKTYWLSICTPDIPIMLAAQHTNFIDKKHYGGNHITYVAWYVSAEDELWNMSEEEIVKFITPHLKKVNSEYDLKKAKKYLFKAPFAQPVFDKDFLQNKPEFVTPLKNFYLANLDMTYPNDRGTNFAVKLGKKISELI